MKNVFAKPGSLSQQFGFTVYDDKLFSPCNHLIIKLKTAS